MAVQGDHARVRGTGVESDRDTCDRILDSAERLVQTRGFNGYSYADIAAELDLTKAALHYHFRTKADLGKALVVRYADRFANALAEADAAHPTAATRLAVFAQLYIDVVRHGRMCLCGMLAAEYQTLPAAVQQPVVAFFDANEAWLSGVLELGRADGSLHFDGTSIEMGRFVVCELEGAMLLARLHDDIAMFEAAVRRMLQSFAVTGGDRVEDPPSANGDY